MVHALRTIAAPDRQVTRAKLQLNEFGRFVLALNRQSEDVPIEVHGALKIAHRDGHVVESAALESGSRRALVRESHHRQSSHQVAPRESTSFVTPKQIIDDLFHSSLRWFENPSPPRSPL